MAKSPLKSRYEGEVLVLEPIESRLLDAVEVQDFSKSVLALIEPVVNPKVVITFAHVIHMTSSALDALLAINKKVASKNGLLRLCDFNPQIREVFTITRLDKVLHIDSTLAEAVDQLQ